MTEKVSLAAKISARLKGVMHQSSIVLVAAIIVISGMVALLAIFVFPVAPIFAEVFMGILILGFLLFGSLYIWKIDSTDSVLLCDEDGRMAIFTSPSRNLVLTIRNFLKQRNVKPDKIIPPGVDLQSDPSAFKIPTEKETDKILTAEIEEAIMGTVSELPSS